jgi:hypothetical protein
MTQVIQIGDRVITMEIPASMERLPLLILESIVDANQHVEATFETPGTGTRVLPLQSKTPGRSSPPDTLA